MLDWMCGILAEMVNFSRIIYLLDLFQGSLGWRRVSIVTSGCHTSLGSAVGVAAAPPQRLTHRRCTTTSVYAERGILEETVKSTRLRFFKSMIVQVRICGVEAWSGACQETAQLQYCSLSHLFKHQNYHTL